MTDNDYYDHFAGIYGVIISGSPDNAAKKFIEPEADGIDWPYGLPLEANKQVKDDELIDGFDWPYGF